MGDYTRRSLCSSPDVSIYRNKMKKPAYILSIIILILTLIMDAFVFAMGQRLAGVILLMSTLVVFFAGFVWFVLRDDFTFHKRRFLLFLPVFLVAGFFARSFFTFEKHFQLGQEDLFALGQLVMARYQGALWICGIIFTCAFVYAGSLLQKESE